MSEVLFAGAIVLIVGLSAVGALVASAIVAQNWRLIVNMAIAMTGMALIAAACHALRG